MSNVKKAQLIVQTQKYLFYPSKGRPRILKKMLLNCKQCRKKYLMLMNSVGTLMFVYCPY